VQYRLFLSLAPDVLREKTTRSIVSRVPSSFPAIFVAGVDACRPIEMRAIAPRFQYTTRNSETAGQARCCRPGMRMETLRYHLRPLLSYMATGGGSLLDIWTVGLSARSRERARPYPRACSAAIARACTLLHEGEGARALARECGKIDERAYTCVTRDTC